MLLYEIKNIIQSCSIKEIRKFSYTIGIFLLLAGLLLFWKEYGWYITILSAGAVILLSGLTFPVLLKPFYILWMSFAVVLGYSMTRIILTLIYCLLFIPVGIIFRILKKDLLDESFNRQSDSYWIKREDSKYDRQTAERQF